MLNHVELKAHSHTHTYADTRSVGLINRQSHVYVFYYHQFCSASGCRRQQCCHQCVCLCILLYSLFLGCCCCCLLLLFAEQCQRFDVLTICHAKLGSSSRRRGVKINAQQLITPVNPPLQPRTMLPPSQSPSRSLTDLLITCLHQLSSFCCSSCCCWCFCFCCSCSFGPH